MNKTEVLAIILRFLAIAFAFTFLSYVASSLTALQNQAGQVSTYIALVYIAVILLIACLLWFFPLTIASAILPSKDDKVTITNIDGSSILEIGIIIIGVYYLYYAVSDAFYWLFWVLVTARMSQGQGTMSLTPDQWVNIIITVIEFALALYLILGAKGIKTLIYRLRGA